MTVPPQAVFEATEEALDETIGGMFAIPEQHIIEQTEESLTMGAESYETGDTNSQADTSWDPFAGW